MPDRELVERTKNALTAFAGLRLAIVFGSVAAGRETEASDIDVAVLGHAPLTATERLQLTAAIADATGRPVDLVDLSTVGEPLLGQILTHGRRLFGDSTLHAQLLSRHLLDDADFGPYIQRLQRERRQAWIGR
jgi:predicted nucleotidyltransferase